MSEISKVRFNALASYCRSPYFSFFATELAWFEFDQEKLLSTLIHDTDGEFSVVFLARDLKQRFRWVAMTAFFHTSQEALTAMEEKASEILPNLNEERHHGDEKGPAVDFFSPVRPSKHLNPDFVRLSKEEAYSPAREILEPMMRWYEDADGNFVEQFQTSAFDARIWEMYLFAALSEAGYIIDRTHQTPDFIVSGPLGEFSLEATTVNPTRDETGKIVPPPPSDSPEDQLIYSREYSPIRYASALTSKLSKRYWDNANCEGKPLAFAIQDFHAPMSMTWNLAGLPIYLYGYVHDIGRDDDGSLRITPRRVDQHQWGTKVILSGFFRLPDAENVSAVIVQ